ncbi:hypothetical protein GCM10008932_05590 [Alkalibacterium iburiense]|uniref:Uncharacterized protein n=1 Tax=Alkalibacterium iburiense TaxID=290589 RepID=A0ABP3GZD9_9LACT
MVKILLNDLKIGYNPVLNFHHLTGAKQKNDIKKHKVIAANFRQGSVLVSFNDVSSITKRTILTT